MLFSWNMWDDIIIWIFSKFFRRKPIEYTENEFQEVLFKEAVREETEEVTEKTDVDQPICQRRVGRITTLQTDYGLIDAKYFFDIWRLNNAFAKVGQTVQYYAYRTNANAEWKVTKVTVEEWEEGSSSENPSAVIRQCAVIQRIIPVKVEDRRGKVLKLSSNLECNLDKTSADFLPIKGDWIELAVLTEISDDKDESLRDNIIEIQYIKARNSRIYCGEITHLRDGLGIINSEVHFREDVCEPGYFPSINDMVLAKVIESEQGALVSRAILVYSMSNVETGNSLMEHIEQETLFPCRNGIYITEECNKKNLVIGEQTKYSVKLENSSEETQIITNYVFKNSATSKIMTLKDTVLFPYSLVPGQFLELEVIAVATSPGFFSDILIFNFEGGWKIGQFLDFYVDLDTEIRMPPDADRMPLKQGNLKFERRKNAILELCATKNGFIIPGRKTIKAPPFLPTRLEQYPIPKLMEEIFMSETNLTGPELEAELLKTYPFLREELSPDNYQSKFHMLLHLEDIETLVAIKKYDQERVSFDVNGDFLVMQIANLAESRPSLAVGDKLIAADPAVFKENNARYEGFIHKVGSDRIYLKFNESFHLGYSGKDYSVSFSHNRSPIRRCHQALNEVIKNLRFEWLFPSTLGTLKPTQINVMGEFPSSFAERVHQCAVAPKKKPTLPTLKSKTHLLKQDIFWQTEDDEVEDEPSEASGDGPKQPASSHEYSSISITSNIAEIKWQSRTPGKKGAEQTKADEATPQKLPRPMSKGATVRRDKVLKWVNQDLNHFQREAVRNILKGEARPLPYIIFGPPGTGKTITVVETIIQIAFLMEDSRILVATPSNSSADLICERLIGWNLKSMVPGNLTRLVGYNYMIDNRMPPVVKPYASVLDLSLSGSERVHFDTDGVRHTSRESVGRSKITVGTCVSLGSLYSLGFPKNHFTHIVIDEAGQSMEPEVLIPLAFMSDQTQAILAGDPRQLGPVVISTVAKLFGLGDSLLSRFLIRFPYHRDQESYPDTDGYDPRLVTRLLYNYRSIPEILNFYSSLFYDSKLEAQVCGFCSPEADIVNKLKEPLRESTSSDIMGVIFYGVRGVNRQDEDSPSWYNDHEIFQVTKYVVALYKAGLTVNDVGIITPYQKQVMKIREQLRYMDLDLPKVGTVEEFQGQERNVIIISTVRSDEGLVEKDRKFALGFVASQQRLNVAISRARAMLIMIGNPHLLVKEPSCKRLLKMCLDRKCYYGADLPSSLWRQDAEVA